MVQAAYDGMMLNQCLPNLSSPPAPNAWPLPSLFIIQLLLQGEKMDSKHCLTLERTFAILVRNRMEEEKNKKKTYMPQAKPFREIQENQNALITLFGQLTFFFWWAGSQMNNFTAQEGSGVLSELLSGCSVPIAFTACRKKCFNVSLPANQCKLMNYCDYFYILIATFAKRYPSRSFFILAVRILLFF